MASQPRSWTQKSRLKPALRRGRAAAQRAAAASSPVVAAIAARARYAGVDVALDLAQGDRRVGQTAVVVAHAVPRVLPALVGQPAGGRSPVLDVTVAVAVAEVVDPGERPVGVRAAAGDSSSDGQPPAGQLAEQHHEQRRGVD